MNVLMVHNYYQQRGGEDESFETERALLTERGHVVSTYIMHNVSIEGMGRARLALATLWNADTYRSVRSLIREKRPSLVHFQNTFPLISPSALYACRAEGVPVVLTLRNYRLLCPSATFFRAGRVCEDCLGQPWPWPGLLHRCYRESFAASGTVALLLAAHRVRRTWQRQVNAFIALTEFSRQKFVANGLPDEHVHVKPNCVSPDPGDSSDAGAYALFVGRLSGEKGIETLLEAWQQLALTVPLRIVGEGPLAPLVERAASQNTAIEWLGRQPVRTVYELMGRARFVVFPSRWYETFGRIAIEAFATGRAIIASDIGALSEVVEHERTGFLVPPGDATALAQRVAWAWNHPVELREMGRRGRHEFEAKYTAEANYTALTQIYAKVLG